MEKLDLFALKARIDEYNKKIEELLSPNQFILNNMIVELTAKISELQNKCPHDFEDGYCKWCYKSEK